MNKFELIIPGEEKYAEHYLNEYGQLVFRKKSNHFIFAMRSYHWKNRVIIIDESFNEKDQRHGRSIIADTLFTELDLSEWEIMTFQEHSMVKSCYFEAYSDTNPNHELNKMFAHL